MQVLILHDRVSAADSPDSRDVLDQALLAEHTECLAQGVARYIEPFGER